MTQDLFTFLDREYKVIGGSSQIRFYPAVIDRGEGAYLYDISGRRYLDFNASWAVANTGYGHPKIVEAAIETYRKITSLSYTTFSHKSIVELAEKLLELTPDGDKKKVLFGHSGSDANDGVFKLVPYHMRRPRLISFIGSYHGQTMGSYSLSGHKAQSKIIGFPNIVKVPYPYGYRCPFKGIEGQKECEEACIDFLENYILKTVAPPETVAGIITEPIQSDGGDIVPTPNFLKELRRIADENNMLLIVDEVKVGVGRTGRFYAFEHSNIKPDVIVLGKPLASGLPISVIILPSEIADNPDVMHLFTLAPHPMIATAAIKTIEVIFEEKLIDNAAEIGEYLLRKLQDLKNRHEIIGDVRGRGLIIGVEIVKDKKSRKPNAKDTAKIVYRAWELGLITAYTGLYSNVIELTPPLIINKEQADEALNILSQAIEDVEEGKVSDEKIKRFVGW